MIQVVMVLTDKLEVKRIDVARLVGELIEIYSTPTPKGWREARKVIVLIDCVFLYNSRGPIFIPGT